MRIRKVSAPIESAAEQMENSSLSIVPIYLDHNATTPVDPDVVETMLPFLGGTFGNASSVHSFGRDAKVALENAREQIASFINCDPSELCFTSGGTESDNIAVLGTAVHVKGKKDHLIICATEHHAVLEPAEHLAHRHGWSLGLLPVNSDGITSSEILRQTITDRTALVSIMHANNETGTIQDIRSLALVAGEMGVLFHTDAVQSIGKIAVDVKQLGVDMLSLTGHKIYGPKGTGALFIRSGIKLSPLFYGGSHERKRRPGTENVAGAVGLAKALEIAADRMQDDAGRMSKLADYFISELTARIPDAHLNGPKENRIAPTVNVSLGGCEGESLLLSLDLKGIACSSGSVIPRPTSSACRSLASFRLASSRSC
ncbi:MAG: cysteine desulfurase family protein [Candidatus Zixiibacteriota bacterium]